jgi:hypothetical protein
MGTDNSKPLAHALLSVVEEQRWQWQVCPLYARCMYTVNTGTQQKGKFSFFKVSHHA